MAIIACCVKWY